MIPASSHPPASISEFFNSYWEAISRRNWTAVILHSWRNLPEKIESDVDYAVRGTQPRELLEFLAKYSRSKGWRLIQVIEHEPDAYFCVCVQRTAPYSHLQLDVTWSYSRLGHHLVGADLLFENKRDIPGKSFHVTSPGTEFTYLLAKAAAKGKNFSDIREDLNELLREDAAGCHRSASRAFGAVPDSTSSECETLSAWSEWFDGAPFFKAVRKGRKFRIPELLLYLRRILHPTGFMIPTGRTVNDEGISRIADVLAPAFRHTNVLRTWDIRNRLNLLQRLIRTTLVIDAREKADPHQNEGNSDADAIIVAALETLAKRVDRRIRSY